MLLLLLLTVTLSIILLLGLNLLHRLCCSFLTAMNLAKAKYDNLAECPDELAFRRGDILTVVSQNLEGLSGWWLCSLRGRQGIVPANRLTLLAGMYNESSLSFSTDSESVCDVCFRTHHHLSSHTINFILL